MNYKEFLSYVRRTAKDHGATLKTDKSKRYNDTYMFYIIDRKTKKVLCENCTLNSAYCFINEFIK